MGEKREAPRARTSGLVVKVLGDEVLVYDLARHRAHRLNHAAAALWRRLDGRTSVAELAGQLPAALGGPVEEAAVWRALAQLDRARLLEAPLRAPGLSRRQWLRRAGMAAGATAALVPVVSTIVVPEAAAQTSACTAGSCLQTLKCAGGSGQCFCVTTTDGPACVEPCCVSGTEDCSSSVDCFPGEVCVSTCCDPDHNACMPRCGQASPPASHTCTNA